MVMLSEQLPFTVSFRPESKSLEAEVVSYYVQSEEELLILEQPGVDLKENTKYTLFFESSVPNAKLYLEILDALPQNSTCVHSEAGETYVVPSGDGVPLFLEGYVPWIPSIYHLCVRVAEDAYFTRIRILPKMVNESELDLMRSELTEEIQELASELVRRHLTLGHPIAVDVPGLNIVQFQVMMRHVNELTAAVLDLIHRANHGIVKTYQAIPAAGGVESDEWATRRMLQTPLPRGEVLTPRRVISHDRTENRWIVFITERVIQALRKMINALQEHCDKLEQAIKAQNKYVAIQSHTAHDHHRKQSLLAEIRSHLQTTCKVERLLRLLRSAPWYQSILAEYVHSRRPAFTHALVTDARYRAFYKLYRELNDNELQIDMSSRYALQWRPTSQLYEMWGFIKVIRELAGLGYELTEGPFYQNTQDGTIHIHEMHQGMAFQLERDNIRIGVVYDGQLPTRSSHTTVESPVFTTLRHNRPDGKMDVYKDGIYFGSLMFDFKYRPVSGFWKMAVDPSTRPKEMDQICSYQSGCRSRFLYGTHQTPVQAWPVKEVWAIHPSGNTIEEITDYAVKLVPLRPGNDTWHIGLQLESVIQRIICKAE